MDLSPTKLFVALQFLALLHSKIVVFADQSKAISHNYKPVALLHGSVYCKSCNYRGTDNLDGATPIEGALVKLSCKSAKNLLVQETKTNKNGNFLFKKPKQLSQEEFMACKAYLVSSSMDSCNKATDLNFGLSGSTLSHQIHKITTKKPIKYDIFAFKPFAFETTEDGPCEEQKSEEIDEVICNPQCVLINYGCYC